MTVISAAREASVEAASGVLVVAETARTIGDLKTVSTKAADAMSSLEERSSQVEEIVDTIAKYSRPNQSPRAQRGRRHKTRDDRCGRGDAVVNSIDGFGYRGITARVTFARRRRCRDCDDDECGRILGRPGEDVRDASLHVTQNMASASAAVEKRGGGSGDAQHNRHVTQAMVPVTAATSKNAATAQEVASSASELAGSISAINSTVKALRDQAEDLKGLVAKFTLGDRSAAQRDASRAIVDVRRPSRRR